MSTALIAGCGYVGQAAADLFLARGWHVEGWTASRASAEELAQRPYPVRPVDITDPRAIAHTRGDFDVVIHCASSGGGDEEDYRRIYLQGAGNLLRIFPGATLLFTSSTSVYAQREGEIVDEESPANPNHEKGKILRAAEEAVLGANGIVLRLAGIYGPSRSFLLKRFLAGEAIIDPNDNHFLNQAHRDDIAAALLLLAEQKLHARGQIYNVVDDQPVRAREIYEWLSAHLNRPLPPEGLLGARKKRGESNKRVSNKRLRDLGWQPRFPTFRSAMAESILPSFGLQAAED